LAEGPRIAAMLARAAMDQPLVVPSGENYHALADLSVTALPLPDATLRMLQQVGIATIGQLRALPAASLALRLGSAAVRVMGLLRGDDCAPLQPYVPPEQPCERIDLERETSNVELLSFVLKSICDRLAQRLEGRGLGATSIKLTLRLDRGIAPDAADVVHVFELSAPVYAADVLLALLRGRLTKLTLAAPVKSVSCTLRALVAVTSHSGTLFSIQRRALGAFDKVLAELEGELGAGNVGRLSVDDSWALAARSKLLAWGVRPPVRTIDQTHEFAQLNVIEPTRLLACPTRISEPVQALRLVVRHEATAWWSGNGAGMCELLFAYWNHQAVLVEKSHRGTFLVGYVD
jgi:protein ImuB